MFLEVLILYEDAGLAPEEVGHACVPLIVITYFYLEFYI